MKKYYYESSKFSLIYFVSFLLVINSSIIAQIDTSKHVHFYNQIFEDGKNIAAQPLQWDSTDWLTFGGVAAGTYLTYTFTDKEVHQYFKDRPELKDKTFFKLSKMYGEPLVTGLVAGGLYIYSLSYDSNQAGLIAFEVLESLGFSLALNIGIKTFIGRSRPYKNEGDHKFDFFNLGYGTTSFPSGHTTVAFSLSSVLASHTDNYLYKALLFTPAFFTAAQRMVQDQHWSSDVFAGAAIGFFVGNYLTGQHEKSKYLPFVFLSDGDNLILTYYYKF